MEPVATTVSRDKSNHAAYEGRLSKNTGCNIETIRYYERIGLLPAPPHSAGGHRLYGEAHLKRLTFVRRGRELGFTLDDIRGLLGLVDGGAVLDCPVIDALFRAGAGPSAGQSR